MTGHSRFFASFLSLSLLLLCGAPVAGAVEASTAKPAPPPVVNAAKPAAPASAPAPVVAVAAEDANLPFKGSLFFTPANLTAIGDALQGKAQTEEKAVRIIPHSVIRLSGVLWRSAEDWIVWVNGQKVTPGRLLPEIRGIKVDSSSQVRFKWYDAGYDSVISVTLKPDQTYDVGTGILLTKAK